MKQTVRSTRALFVTGCILGLILLEKGSALLKTAAFAARFGAESYAGAFSAGWEVAQLLLAISAAPILGCAFLPAYCKMEAISQKTADRFFLRQCGIFGGGMLILAALCLPFAGRIIHFSAPGLIGNEEVSVATTVLRIALCTLPAAAVAQSATLALQARGRPMRAALPGLLPNLVATVFLTLGKSLVRYAIAPSVATVLGALIGMWLAHSHVKEVVLSPSPAIRSGGVALFRAARTVLSLAWLQPWSAVLVMRAASHTAEGGGLAALALAEKMTAGVFSVLAIPITAWLYPALSRAIAHNRRDEASALTRKTLLAAFAAGCALAFFFALGAPIALRILLPARPASAERLGAVIRVLSCGIPLSAASCVVMKAEEASGGLHHSVRARAAGACLTALLAGVCGRAFDLSGAALAEVLGQAATLGVLLAARIFQTEKEEISLDSPALCGE